MSNRNDENEMETTGKTYLGIEKRGIDNKRWATSGWIEIYRL